MATRNDILYKIISYLTPNARLQIDKHKEIDTDIVNNFVHKTDDESMLVTTALQTKIDSSYAHQNNTSNPHNVSRAQVGLSNVTNDEQVKRSEMGMVNGVATLGSDGKLISGQLPDLAINDVFISSQNTLALFIANEWNTVNFKMQKGDIVKIVTADTSVEIYMLAFNNGSVASDYLAINNGAKTMPEISQPNVEDTYTTSTDYVSGRRIWNWWAKVKTLSNIFSGVTFFTQDISTARNKYIYFANSMTSDTIYDYRFFDNVATLKLQRCTVSNPNKGIGTWVDIMTFGYNNEGANELLINSLKIISGSIKNSSSFSTSSSYVVGERDCIIFLDATNDHITAQLGDTAPLNGINYTFKKTDNSANSVRIKPYASQLIDKSSSYFLTQYNEAISIYTDGTEWFIKSSFKNQAALSGDISSHYHTVDRYTHPANHPASIITQDETKRFVTDAEKSMWNAKQAALSGDVYSHYHTGDRYIIGDQYHIAASESVFTYDYSLPPGVYIIHISEEHFEQGTTISLFAILHNGVVVLLLTLRESNVFSVDFYDYGFTVTKSDQYYGIFTFEVTKIG